MMDSQRILKQSASMYLLVHGLIQTKKVYRFGQCIQMTCMALELDYLKIHLKNILGKKIHIIIVTLIKKIRFHISEKKAKGENYFISPFYEEFFSVKVNYSDDEDKLNPCIKEKDQVYLQNIGTYKNKAWEFQAEWRYKLVCFPEPYEKVGNANTCFLMEQGVLLPVTSIDLKIDDAYFEQMEILTGPKMTGEERHFLDFLIDEYGASIKNPVHSSQLKIR